MDEHLQQQVMAALFAKAGQTLFAKGQARDQKRVFQALVRRAPPLSAAVRPRPSFPLKCPCLAVSLRCSTASPARSGR